jgi:hypothetical protein
MTDLHTPLADLKRGRAAVKTRESGERREKLEQIQRWLEDGTLVVRWAEPGELPPPKNLNPKAEKARSARPQERIP